jgi:FlaA1/EpsC-like NDP-sugar epimerase
VSPLARRLQARLRHPQRFFLDVVLWTLATPAAFLLRFDGTVPPAYREAMWVFLGLGAAVKFGAVLLFRLHMTRYRKVAFQDVGMLVWAVGAVTVVLLFAAALMRPGLLVPRSIPLLEAGVALLLLFGIRAAGRRLDERRRDERRPGSASVLILGAGEAGTLLAREMQRHPEMGLRPIGFIDDDADKLGVSFGGVRVLGTRADLPHVLRAHPVDEVLVATPSADGRFVREALAQIRQAGHDVDRPIRTRVMPGVYELLSGDVSIGRLREVRVEDLLRRKPVRLDLTSIQSFVGGRVVLVTGAGGSIGSEIARQTASFAPAALLLLGRGENSLFEIDRELRRQHPDLRIEVVLASVREPGRLRTVFERYRPQVVFHAAAHKHVPMMEAHPEEAVLNNVMGTRNLVDLALAHGVERFVNVSTDKAVNPTSVMGASKRIAEAIVKDAAARTAPGQRFVSVRFGNVLGSRGSVVPLFRGQIEHGGPITITDRRMTRYFMTIPEASQLVLQAAALAENAAVYFLDMGEPVRIYDLAEDLIRLSGMEPHVDIEIREVGVRPGEKLFEELVTAGESPARAVHEKIFVANGDTLGGAELRAVLADLERLADAGDRQGIVDLLHEHVPGSALTAATRVMA